MAQTQETPAAVQQVVTAALIRPRSLLCLVAGALGALGPPAWLWPWLVAWLVLYGASAILSALDTDFIAAVLEDGVALAEGGSEEPRRLSAGEAASEAGLSGPSSEAYRKVARVRAQIHKLLEGAGDDGWVAASRESLAARLDAVVDGVRTLCLERQRFQGVVGRDGPAKVRERIADLEARVDAASEAAPRDKLAEALTKKREELRHLERIQGGLAHIDAQLEHLVASLEEIRARIAALRLERKDLPSEERERLNDQLASLEDEAAVLEETLRGP